MASGDDETKHLGPNDVPTLVERPSTASSFAHEPAFGADYQDEGVLGSGGMGEVRASRDPRIGRTVARKLIHRAYANHPELRARFLREAHVQGMLEHPSIVPVYELGQRDDVPYFTMKRVGGHTLRDVLHAGAELATRFTPRKLLAALSQVSLTVHYAHTKGVIHRDLKPSNIMFGDFGEVYVLDWGIAAIGEETSTALATPLPLGLTAPGVAAGTLGYMAPEQLRGEKIDERADVYALGVILYAILARAPLHTGPSEEEIKASTIKGVDIVARLAEHAPDAAPELVELCRRATALARDERLATALAMSEAIEKFLEGDRDLEVRRTLARDHLAKASARFPPGDDDAQREALLRDAGRALALDPNLVEAADLIHRVVIAPPTKVPPAVRATLEAAALERKRRLAWLGKIAIVYYIALLPGLLAARSVELWAAAGAIGVTSFVVSWRGARAPRTVPSWLLLASHLMVVVLLERMYSIIATPAFAVSFGAMFASALTTRRAHAIALWLFAASCVLVPLVLGQLGWIPASFEFGSDGLRLTGLSISDHRASMNALFTVFVFLVVGLGIAHGYVLRRNEDRLLEQLHVQRWQLGHLASPDPAKR